MEDRKLYQVKTLNRFAASEKLTEEFDINSAWEIITEFIKTSATESQGYYELKKYKASFEKVPKIIRAKEVG